MCTALRCWSMVAGWGAERSAFRDFDDEILNAIESGEPEHDPADEGNR